MKLLPLFRLVPHLIYRAGKVRIWFNWAIKLITLLPNHSVNKLIKAFILAEVATKN